MKKLILLLPFLLFLNFYAKAQNYYWVAFTDKNNTEFSLSKPEDYLSGRAIERRKKQNIAIDSLDLPVLKTYIDSVLTLNAELVHSSKWLNGITIKTNFDSLEQTLSGWSFIREVQLSKPNTKAKSTVIKFRDDKKDDPILIDTSFYGESVYQLGIMEGQFLHNKGFYGQGVQIAVLDAGFYNANKLPAFDSLWHNNQILGIKDFVQPDVDIFTTHNHGMNVLSCMGGNIPGKLVGTAPKASYWLIRSEDASSEYIIEEDNWVVAAEFADSVGVDIINSSLGYNNFDDPSTSHIFADMDGRTTRVTKGANVAASRGILVFSSAGNERRKPWKRIIAPSDGDEVIGVGAVDKNLHPASFTSVGPSADNEVKPNVSALGYHSVVQKKTGEVAYANGTSFASPILAGIAACLWQYYPNKTAEDIKSAIEKSGHKYLSPDSLLGYGVPNMQVAAALLKSLGVNAYQAILQWQAYPNPVVDKIILQQKGNNYMGKITIEMYSVRGQLLRKWVKSAASEIILRDIPEKEGVFLLKLSTNTYVQTIKLYKTKR